LRGPGTPGPGGSGPLAAKLGWLQVNVALERRSRAPLDSARDVFRELQPLLRRWRRRRSLRRFFFMRKPPGIRLRFLGPDPRRRILPDLQEVLTRLRRRRRIRRFFCSVYEPEIRSFGGASAMDLVHAYFEVDSAAWIELDQLSAAGRGTLAADVVSLAAVNDLFLRALEDAGEVWDAWCNLAELRPAPKGDLPRLRVPFLAGLLPMATATERRVLRRYARANQVLARGLSRLWSRGALSTGLRAILPFVAAFHFNRHGVGGPAQSRLVGAMAEAWRPQRGMRGEEQGRRC